MADIQVIANGKVACDAGTFEHGEGFMLDDQSDEFKTLRKLGAILLPSEVMPAEQVSSEISSLQSQNSQLLAQKADLEAQLQALQAGKKNDEANT